MSSSADRGEPVSDEELLRRYLGGEAEAFRPLIQRYEKPIYNFILRSVRRPDRAEEILQDTFLKVVQRAHDFKGQSKFSTWLFTIARNLCIDHSRKMVFRRHRSLDARTDAGEGPTLLDRTANRDAAVDRRAMAADLQARIAEAVEDLPEEQREVFLLRQVEGMPFKEIAEVVGVPENTVKSRMRYALERLQRALSQYEELARELTTA
jgi:RNA polymerase sigma-70 factor (ECF subfamily)